MRNIIDPRATGLSPAQDLGWLRAAPATGALVIALLLAHLPPIHKAGRSMLLAVVGFGATKELTPPEPVGGKLALRLPALSVTSLAVPAKEATSQPQRPPGSHDSP